MNNSPINYEESSNDNSQHTPNKSDIKYYNTTKPEWIPSIKQYQYDKKYKMIIIGNSNVGKTCLILKAVKNNFNANIKSTIGFEYYNIVTTWNNSKIILQTWDTCGQEIFRSIINTFYNRAKLAILVYSIDDKESFRSITYWLTEIRNYAAINIKLVLVGNKADLNSTREISYKEGEDYAKENKIDMFFEASAKEGWNAKNIFIRSAQMLYEFDIKNNNNTGDVSNTDNKVFTLHQNNEGISEGESCSDC